MAGARPRRSTYGSARVSPQRRHIAEVAAGLGGAFTVEELAAAVRKRDASIGLATVYRAVNALEIALTVERVGEKCGSALFAYCESDGHHHHLVCTGCGRIEHAPCPLGETPATPASHNGFTITGHEVKLYGLCPACAGPEAGL